MRRAAVIALVAVAVAVGTWYVVRSGPVTAQGLADQSCSSLAAAFRWRGDALRNEAARAVGPARQAAAKKRQFRDFAAAITRLTALTPVSGAGTVARPPDLALVSSTCHSAVVAKSLAVVTRTPYLTDATPHSVMVNFATDRLAAGSAVSYGTVGGNCGDSHSTPTTDPVKVAVGTRTDFLYQVELTGLSPGTGYCYQLGGSVFDLSTRAVPPRFVTAAAPDDHRPFSFAVIGDWGGGTGDQANVLAQIASGPASFIVTSGDNAYISGNQTDYGDLSDGHVFGPDLWPRVGSRLPTFATQGNHGFSIYQPQLQSWPQPETVLASGGAYQRDKYCCTSTLSRPYNYASTWYAFDWGPARFYVLDGAWADHTGDYTGDFLAHWNGPVAGCPACGAELQWLQTDLAAHAATPVKFAFFHYPLYSDASDHLSDTLLAGPTRLEGLLARNRVDIVFNGHAHLYERNAPQIPGSPMVSYVTGGGGVRNGTDTLASVIRCSAFDAYAIGLAHTSCHAPQPVSDQAVYHYLLVTVDGTHVTVTPTDENGHTFDVQTLNF